MNRLDIIRNRVLYRLLASMGAWVIAFLLLAQDARSDEFILFKVAIAISIGIVVGVVGKKRPLFKEEGPYLRLIQTTATRVPPFEDIILGVILIPLALCASAVINLPGWWFLAIGCFRLVSIFQIGALEMAHKKMLLM